MWEAIIPSIFADRCSHYAAMCVYCYDYCLTLGTEVTYLWHGKMTPVKLMYYINRYVGLAWFFLYVLYSVPFQHKSDYSCNLIIRSMMILDVLMSSSSAASLSSPTNLHFTQSQ